AGAEHCRVIGLKGPRAPRVIARHTRRAGAAHGILRVVIEESVHVEAEHHILAGRETMVDTAIEQLLTVISGVREIPIRWQNERRQRVRKERGAVLPGIVIGDKKEGLVLNEPSAE